MANFLKNEVFTDQSFTHQYSGIDNVQLANAINDLLARDGYKVIEGQVGNAGYEKGNRIVRLLFGAFVKYSKIHAATATGTDSITRLTVDRKTSGMSGGLIGMRQVKKEMERIAALMATI